MRRDDVPESLARQVTPRALRSYAAALGWEPVSGTPNGDVAVYHRPEAKAKQLIIPLDEEYDDYADRTRQAILRLAEFEKRSPSEVLDLLLLPPADVLRFRQASPDTEAGTLPLEHAVRLINGTRRLLLSAAHSVLVPQPYHPRLSRSEAEEFVNRCRLGQTERGSFVFSVACPLDQPLPLPGAEVEPFTRRVTTRLMQALEALARAEEAPRLEELVDPKRSPGLSANLCESLLLLQPEGDRASLTVSATWSRALLPEGPPTRQVQLRQEAFRVAEALAPRLRSQPIARLDRFLGFVDALRGQPRGGDSRPSGEVDFTLFDDEEGEIRARGVLTAEQYAIAGAAHLASDAVSFKAILRRLPRIGRLDSIADFKLIRMTEEDLAN
jgi:hypothetical protein